MSKPSAAYRRILQDDIRDGIIHGAALLSGTGDRIEREESFGYAENSLTCAMTPDTVIDVASVSKMIAVITPLLICHSRGLIDLDAPFPEYLTAYRPRLQHKITVRDLANHTSGFGDVPGQAQRLYFEESGTEILRNVLRLPPPFLPTEQANYACWNYLLLGLLLEEVTGRTLTSFCEQEVFQPLGMNDTRLGAPPEHVKKERLAQTILTEKPGEISDFVAYRVFRDGKCAGNAGVFSSARDLAKLLFCYLNGGSANGTRLFSELSLSECLPDRAKRQDGYRKFGWVIFDPMLNDAFFGSSLFHSGWSGQTLFMDFQRKRFVVLLTTRCGDYDRAKADRLRVVQQVCGKQGNSNATSFVANRLRQFSSR